jgi:hypothetical protein
MKSQVFSMLLALIFAGPGVAVAGPNGSIDLFWIDPQTGIADLTSCQGTTDFIPGVFGDIELSVQARLGGLTAAGVIATELFVEGLEGLPRGWRASAETLGSISIGSIVGISQVGGQLVRDGSTAFSNCQSGPSGFVEFYHIRVTGTAVTEDLPSDMRVRVVAGSPPANPEFPCPVLNLCDGPVFTQVCVTGGEFIINPMLRNCTVGLETRTWSGVKDLYR